MAQRAAVSELIELGCRRAWFLERLAVGPAERGALESSADVSRSTVARGIEELSSAELIEPASDGYRLTLYGRVVHEMLYEFGETLATLDRTTDLLAPLPRDAPLDTAIVRAGTPRRGQAARDRTVSMLSDADRVRLALADTPPGLDLYADAVDADTRLQAVLPASETRRLAVADGETPLASAPSVDVSLRETADPLPYTLVLAGGPDATAVGLCGHVDRALAWLISTADEMALDWAEATFDCRWHAGRPLPAP